MSGVGATVIAIDETVGVAQQVFYAVESTLIALPENARVFYLQSLWSREALWHAQTTSELNGPMTLRAPVWRVALDSLTRPLDDSDSRYKAWGRHFVRQYGSFERVQPSRKDEAPKRVYAGDRPKGRVNGAGDIASYPREVQSIDALAKALWWREDAVESELSRIDPTPLLEVRRTHRAIHEALAGESTKGCKWCEEGGR